MRPPVSWADLRERPVGVWGAGVEGRATLRRLAVMGIVPEVVVDDRPPSKAIDGVTVAPTSPAALARLGACTYVVKSPGISRHGEAARTVEAGGARLVGGLGLWLEEADGSRVACVTGTKGKSTTSSVAAALAERLGTRCFVGGNLGSPPWDPEASSEVDRWIIETSSYQAADVSRSPEVVVVTSLSDDHLDWHGDRATYVADKLSLCSQPGARVTVANGDDARVRAHAHLLGPEVVWVELPASPPAWAEGLGLLGAHNLRNALMAQRALIELGVDGAEDGGALAAAAAAGVPGLESRLELVATVDGVRFVDDGLATNVLPTAAALAAFAGQRIALLVGGQDRGIDYAPLADAVASAGEVLVLAMPDNGPRIAAALRQAPLPASVEVREVADLEAAVAAGFGWARPGGVVLLSPAAPSFGHYRDYRDRAAAFRAAAATHARK
jgi:UDP-N-acetylmuramoylalanine--D-glutamate ligase